MSPLSRLDGRRAAQYLRVSNDDRVYSLPVQAEAIAQFAARQGCQIVRSYEDFGVSGLSLKGRDQLKALLADAVRPDRGFDLLLVYDVSRWGRFQDIDEGAHYEFLCRQAGLPVLYCAEPFLNDGSAFAEITKNLKRAMAAEFSRDLSARIAAGKLRQLRRGFLPGGAAAYGFRRRLVLHSGERRNVMVRGHLKSKSVGRTLIEHGPAEELEAIRQLFRLFVEDGIGLKRIAETLEARGCRRPGGWTSQRVKDVLRNELVTGTYVYGRRPCDLGRGQRTCPTSDGIRVQLLEPIVPPALFRRAQRRLATNPNRCYSDDGLIRRLKAVARRHGRISKQLLLESPGAASPATYVRRFGSWRQACARAGLEELAAK